MPVQATFQHPLFCAACPLVWDSPDVTQLVRPPPRQLTQLHNVYLMGACMSPRSTELLACRPATVDWARRSWPAQGNEVPRSCPQQSLAPTAESRALLPPPAAVQVTVRFAWFIPGLVERARMLVSLGAWEQVGQGEVAPCIDHCGGGHRRGALTAGWAESAHSRAEQCRRWRWWRRGWPPCAPLPLWRCCGDAHLRLPSHPAVTFLSPVPLPAYLQAHEAIAQILAAEPKNLLALAWKGVWDQQGAAGGWHQAPRGVLLAAPAGWEWLMCVPPACLLAAVPLSAALQYKCKEKKGRTFTHVDRPSQDRGKLLSCT